MSGLTQGFGGKRKGLLARLRYDEYEKAIQLYLGNSIQLETLEEESTISYADVVAKFPHITVEGLRARIIGAVENGNERPQCQLLLSFFYEWYSDVIDEKKPVCVDKKRVVQYTEENVNEL
ncbi:hypothetical protein CYMTET_8101 [Cymbomonas tetramitiformis]|uniref:Uncharacterized protein n=1 Tax=Cymbomonas tetramitiformis TaxID=36881 RepID=A0AAE0KTW6_9CHLO|nr:hypothetical protein CYMTET_30733 [Cymbomonas tetramitiformis]KAK3284236.1 hypothetical protein CYMTET_8101 [Cymbomonas tetramitiformis]